MAPTPIQLWGPESDLFHLWPLRCSSPAAGCHCCRAEPAHSLPCGWTRRGHPEGKQDQKCHPSDIVLNWQPPLLLSKLQKHEVTTHPSTTVDQALQVLGVSCSQRLLRHHQCPCADIVRLQVASHLLCLEPLPPSGCCWPELLSGGRGDQGSLEFPTDYGTLKHPPQDGSRGTGSSCRA